MIFQTKDYGLQWITLNGIQPQLIKSINENNTLIVEDRVYKLLTAEIIGSRLGLNISETFLIQIFSIDSAHLCFVLRPFGKI